MPNPEHAQASEELLRTSADVSSGTVSSSRDSLAGAGWTCRRVGRFRRLVPGESSPFSWLDPVPLWQSRNQVLGQLLGDPTNDERRSWMEVQREAGKLSPDLILKEYAGLEEVSFVMIGDPGEGDASQFALVPPLLARGGDTHFMVICSDVIYPAGDSDDYEDKFYRPYEGYPAPIYALPGNHDWYDGLAGFMFHLCNAETAAPKAANSSSWKERLRWRLWRKPRPVDPEALARREAWRSAREQRSSQRSPYFAIETGPLLIVGIDTGMGGSIDREQGQWLRRISREIDKPKLLLTGKPIYVDGEYHPGVIEGGGTVDEIVRAPEHNYVAAIGGDTHNYQRYPVRLADGRKIEYIVSGGGGAYMSATHRIPYVNLPGVNENDFRCYPRRGDSLSFYSNLYDRRFGFGKGWFEIPPDEAAAYMAQRLGIEPAREGDRAAYISRRARRVAGWLLPLPGRGRGPLHHFFSEFFDWNEPPLFKNFLRIDASGSELRIRCFAATGCAEHEENPPLEDQVSVQLHDQRSVAPEDEPGEHI